jgi:hypothetical protein
MIKWLKWVLRKDWQITTLIFDPSNKEVITEVWENNTTDEKKYRDFKDNQRFLGEYDEPGAKYKKFLTEECSRNIFNYREDNVTRNDYVSLKFKVL